MTALILSPLMAQATAVARHLRGGGRSRIVAGLIDEGAVEGHAALRAYDRVIRIRGPQDIARFHPVIPTGSECTAWLVRHGIPIHVGDVEFAPGNIRCNNKSDTLSIAASLGVPVPETWHAISDIPADAGPIFYKPVIEGTGGPRDVAANAQVLPAVARSGYLYQEFISSPGVFAVAFIARHGRIVESYQHEELASYPTSGGSAVAVRGCDRPRLTELTGRLLGAFDYHGWGLAEFKFCPRRNDFVLMEINAKLWASMEYGLRSNARFAGLLFGCRAAGATPPGLFWPNRAMRNGLTGLRQWWRWGRGLPTAREPLDWRAPLHGIIPDRLRRHIRARAP